MPVEGINKVNEPLVVKERPDIASGKDEERNRKARKKKHKAGDKDRKRKGLVDIMA